ncbi:P-loop containing nucleoside triphosphate hydrolase protein [Powellomyces hirtus]|nr:P-loop containing nucleoside triphosphate hydrolase protein [Powellomyces hirtus]
MSGKTLAIQQVIRDCTDNIVYLPRNCTFHGLKLKSGFALELQKECLARTVLKEEKANVQFVKVRLCSFADGVTPGRYANAVEGRCRLTAAVAIALGCKEGDAVNVLRAVNPISVPRAKTVFLYRDNHISASARKLAAQGSTAFDARLVRQAALGGYGAPGQMLSQYPNGPPMYRISAVIPSGENETTDEVVLMDQDTQYILQEPPTVRASQKQPMTSQPEWLEGISRRVAGMDAVAIRMMIALSSSVESVTSICHLNEYPNLRPQLVSGLILNGRPGVGKSTLARAVAEHSGLAFDFVKCADLLQFSEGDAELYFADLFENAKAGQHKIIILDEIDAIAAKMTGNQINNGPASKIYSVLLSLIDGRLASHQHPSDAAEGITFVIAITNRLHVLDTDLLRSGRLSTVIETDVVDARQRLCILQHICKELPIDPIAKSDILQTVSDITHGFVGADLESLCYTAVSCWQQHHPNDAHLSLADFTEALKLTKPASFQELSSHIPRKNFSDLFGLDDVIQLVLTSVLRPFTNLDKYTVMGITAPRGVLLHGPAGVGKSVLSYALVQEAGFNCVYVDGPKIRSKVVGESEQNIARIFAQARANAPCILLIDQIDMLVPSRGMDTSSENTGERIVTCFLVEMDGVMSRSAQSYNTTVFIVGVTNRPHIVDPAILRPGRMDQHIFVPAPGKEARRAIYKGFLANMPNTLTDEDVQRLAEESEGYTGADIESICREAALLRLRADLSSQTITDEDVRSAMKTVRRSYSAS